MNAILKSLWIELELDAPAFLRPLLHGNVTAFFVLLFMILAFISIVLDINLKKFVQKKKKKYGKNGKKCDFSFLFIFFVFSPL